MTEHERAAMEAAFRGPGVRIGGNTAYLDIFRWGWEAARKYEPPAVCMHAPA